MFVLIAPVYEAMERRTFFPKGGDIREGFKTWHFILGSTVVALVIVRIALRLLTNAPPIVPTPPKWQS